MRKWLALLGVLSLFVFNGSALAQSSHHDHGNHADKKNCGKIPPGLLKALQKSDNAKAKKAISQAIERHKQKCSDDGEDHGELSDAQRVKKDKADLQVGFTGNENSDNVYGPLRLPTKGEYGSTISWTSSSPAIISNDGLTIHRPATDHVNVIMTAKIRYESEISTKSFTLRVIGLPLSQTQRVAKDKEALQILYNGTDKADHVTQALKPLPVIGANGCVITWISSAPSIISNDGRTVNPPAAGNGDAAVILTAYIRYQSASDFKIFHLTVKQQLTDMQKVAADIAALRIDYGGSDNAARVTRPLDQLPALGMYGSSVTWISGNPSVLSSDGKSINRPAIGAGDTIVPMTAIVTNHSTVQVKVFMLTVKPLYTNLEKVAADKAELSIGFSGSDNAGSVTKALSLRTSGYYGSTILWYSSAPSIISDNGAIVNRPAHGKGDASVTLTAFISNNGIGDLKTFVVNVKQQS